ncbi:MAG: 2-amino-4-hydroxy-6-hydroxymethyldihydropteridine diphosphokinase [Candidatus Kapabacteria bacterium]|nr:2-amino-4-hydroxy-6-hydroxymethyldihydropteridine diphosphokinase [Candidatus Kapabacteria bacterium]
MPDGVTPLRILLSIGANLGNRQRTVTAAMDMIEEHGLLYECLRSPLYETEPVGFTEQPPFVNCCMSGITTIDIHDVRSELSQIETTLGRTPRAKWHEREIDIDIILAGNHIVNSDALTIPHPRMAERRFVLQPAADIEPAMFHPLFSIDVQTLLERCTDTAAVTLYHHERANTGT